MLGIARFFYRFFKISKTVVGLFFAALFLSSNLMAGAIEVRNNQLFIDGVPQPQLYGAELQYFRLRGGVSKNIPKEKVISLWNKALDRMVEAKMNAISFYIPWDFHEYANGKFDFTGTVDEDGDGHPDYPSRDLVTFFQLIKEHGIKHILVRPGPYINAEWGFLGFGAVPEWFHQQYPNSHMLNSKGQRAKLYDYHNPDFQYYSKRWLKELYNQVLVHYIGPGQPIDFIQLDNETNYQWQSVYKVDYGPNALTHYQHFLEQHYGSLTQLNEAHQRNWGSWDKVMAPTTPDQNLNEDRDWYHFHDVAIHDYLHFVRQIWEELGVKEPTVLFTLAESYNADVEKNGLLPNYIFRNDPGVTGLMTVNLYPKTYENALHSLLNQPFKADHDVKAVGSSNALYLGQRQEWAMGPEIQGGWWRGILVSQKARQQTYLSTIGHGLKALFIYYFNEGDNFGYGWARDQVMPLFQTLKKQPPYADIPDNLLPKEFWTLLQAQVDKELLVGIDVRAAILGDQDAASQLYFDAPLDANANPKKSYELVKHLGEVLAGEQGEFLGRALEMTDPVCLVKDPNEHLPSSLPSIDAALMNSHWEAGLLGLVMQSSINPNILIWGITPEAEFKQCRILMLQDNGMISPSLSAHLKTWIEQGAIVVNFLHDQLADDLGIGVEKRNTSGSKWAALSDLPIKKWFTLSHKPFAVYDVNKKPNAFPFMEDADGKVIGYRYALGKGQFIQVSALLYDVFNSDSYGNLSDVDARRSMMDEILRFSGVAPRLHIVEGGDRVVAFGRQSPEGNDFWITVKSAHQDKTRDIHLILKDVNPDRMYDVMNVLGGEKWTMKGAELVSVGLPVKLIPEGSAVFRIRASV